MLDQESSGPLLEARPFTLSNAHPKEMKELIYWQFCKSGPEEMEPTPALSATENAWVQIILKYWHNIKQEPVGWMLPRSLILCLPTSCSRNSLKLDVTEMSCLFNCYKGRRTPRREKRESPVASFTEAFPVWMCKNWPEARVPKWKSLPIFHICHHWIK